MSSPLIAASRARAYLLSGALLAALAAPAGAQTAQNGRRPDEPVAAARPHELTTHGHTRVDEYYWLRERESPEVIGYLESENAYTAAMTAHTDERRVHP